MAHPEEKDAGEFFERQLAEAAAAEAATADATGQTPPLISPASGDSPEGARATIAADKAKSSGATTENRKRRSIEQEYSEFVGDLDQSGFEQELEIEGSDPGEQIRLLQMKLNVEKEDNRRTVRHLARKLDEALASVESETNAKVSALETAMRAAESEKLEAEVKLSEERAKFKAEMSKMDKKLSDTVSSVDESTGLVATMRNELTAAHVKMGRLSGVYNQSKDQIDENDPSSLRHVISKAFNGVTSNNLFVEPRHQYKINKESPFQPQLDLNIQLEKFFSVIRFANLGKQRNKRSYLELVHGPRFQDELEQAMIEYIELHADYDRAGFSDDDDYHYIYLSLASGMQAVKCGGTFRSYCEGKYIDFKLNTPKADSLGVINAATAGN
eukprot:CAMPEP_0119264896 /NCGR_PEP_ID=MMETSP1329-20130426/3853_1 /TAXON_ID=114041 /ORGANISM="Genus nov. species nov., Strain RCC1024" /LENGTH=385 /DNA_ID=CAMNT_0007264689 /DNA_START=61 /DNA_END=1219 /DNA_ORIENTATION=-